MVWGHHEKPSFCSPFFPPWIYNACGIELKRCLCRGFGVKVILQLLLTEACWVSPSQNWRLPASPSRFSQCHSWLHRSRLSQSLRNRRPGSPRACFCVDSYVYNSAPPLTKVWPWAKFYTPVLILIKRIQCENKNNIYTSFFGDVSCHLYWISIPEVENNNSLRWKAPVPSSLLQFCT